MKKQFEKFNVEQFRAVVGMVPELLSLIEEVDSKMSRILPTKFDAIFPDGFGDYWLLYEMPLEDHLACLIHCMGWTEDLNYVAAADDPQQALLDAVCDGDGNKFKDPRTAPGELISIGYALGRSFLSIATYGRSIYSLLREVHESQNSELLFKAIRIDRTVVGCPTAMRHIARAQLRNDNNFFRQLRNALAGPSKKEWAGLGVLRYALLVLRDLDINDLSEASLEDLIVNELRAYPRASGGGERKNLASQYRRSKKIPTI